MGRGFMRICTARKATRATPPTGTGKPRDLLCAGTLDEEWETIARHLLSLSEPRGSRGEVKQKGQKIGKD
jgi:hypothetical protein